MRVFLYCLIWNNGDVSAMTFQLAGKGKDVGEAWMT